MTKEQIRDTFMEKVLSPFAETLKGLRELEEAGVETGVVFAVSVASGPDNHFSHRVFARHGQMATEAICDLIDEYPGVVDSFRIAIEEAIKSFKENTLAHPKCEA